MNIKHGNRLRMVGNRFRENNYTHNRLFISAKRFIYNNTFTTFLLPNVVYQNTMTFLKLKRV